MLRVIAAVLGKDLTLLLTRGSALLQALLLGLLLVFVFSLAQGPGEHLSEESCATIFWMSSLFCQVLLFNQLYALEEGTCARAALLLLPWPSACIWLAKALAGFLLLFLAQSCFLPATIVFLGSSLNGDLGLGLLAIVLVDLGICTLGSLLGAVAQGQVARESLLSILLFPLLTPLLLAGISLHTACLKGITTDLSHWFELILAFDAIFGAVACTLFAFIYTGDDA